MDIKKEVLETIKKLFFKCGGDKNYEHLYILPSKWIDLLKYEKNGDEILKVYKMPTVRHYCFLLRKLLTIGIPKSTVLVISFRVFIWLLSFKNAGGKSIIHLQSFEMLFQEKGQYHLIIKG